MTMVKAGRSLHNLVLKVYMITGGVLFSGPQSELSRVALNNQPIAGNRLIAAGEIFLTEPRTKAMHKFWWAPLILEGSTFVDCKD